MKNGVNVKIINWLTLIALLLSLFCFFIFVYGVNQSGDTAIAMWAIFVFSFALLSAPLHGFLLLLACSQFFLASRSGFKWLNLYLSISVLAHALVGYQYGAFDDVIDPPVSLTPAEISLQRAFNRHPIDISALESAISEGLDVNSGLMQGWVPYLVQASSMADVAAIQELLKAGANPNQATKGEYSPRFRVSINQAKPLDVLMFADNGDIHKSLTLLLDAGAKPEFSLMRLGACRKGDIGLWQKAVALGAQEQTDAGQKTCLHHAVEMDRTEFIHQLFSLINGNQTTLFSQLQSVSKNNQTPLDLAIGLKHYQAAIALVKRGGVVNQKWMITRLMEDTTQQTELVNLQALLKEKGMTP